MKYLLFILILGSIFSGFSQKNNDKKFGLFAAMDLAYRPADNLRTEGASRKFSFGLRSTTKVVTGLLGVGIKASKLNVIQNEFQPQFLNHLEETYTPINNSSVDQEIGESMYALARGNNDYYTTNSYSQYLHFALQFHSVFLKPIITMYTGTESILLQGPTINESSDFFDYSFANGYSTFTELKIGSSVPLSKKERPNIYLNFNLCYIWKNYHQISFQGVPLENYTSGNISNEYNKSKKLSASVGIILWTK